MANESLHQLAQNMQNLSSAYDNAASPSSNNSLASMADYIGYDAGFPNSSVSAGGVNIALKGAFQDFAIYSSGWEGYRKQRDLGPGGEEYFCNQFVVARTSTITVYALRNSTYVYLNGSQYGNVMNKGNSKNIVANAGDMIGVDRPVNIRSANFDPGVAYLGWMGYAFAHRQDRYSGTTLFVYAPFSSTNVQLLYTTTNDYASSLTSQATATLNGNFWTQSMFTTRNYFLYANKPVAVYAYNVSGAGMQDTLPLYPMDQDDKYGAFSNGGHILTSQNSGIVRAGSGTSQIIYNRSSNGGSTTEVNQVAAAKSVDTDITPGQTSAGFFAGPVQKVQTGANNIFTCESQGDGNGGEQTPFVSSKAFGKSTILTSTADWATCIGKTPMTIHKRSSTGNLLGSQTMSGTALHGLYFTRFTILSAGDVLETTGGSEFICYYDADSSQDDERVNFMSDATLELNPVIKNLADQSFESDAVACAQGPLSPDIPAYFIPSFSLGAQAFTDVECTQELSEVFGPGWYFNFDNTQRFYYSPYEQGGVSDISNCGK